MMSNHHKIQRSLITCAALAATLAMASACFAVPINYGDFEGTTVWYLQVQEDANSAGDAPPMFGAPSVSGDSLDFDPVGFGASASGAADNDLTDGNLKFDIVAKPGKYLTNVQFAEAGDTTLAGFGTDATFTSVTAQLFIDVEEVDGVAITPFNIVADMTFTPSDGDYFLGADGGGGPIYNKAWSGSVTVDLIQALIDNNISFINGATKVTFNLDNTLVANSEAGTSALIAKKDLDGLSVTANVPEPASLALLSLGILGAATYTGRRRR